MANPDFNNIRSLEDISNLLSILYFNMQSLEKNYYDMFINPTPMTINLERYSEDGTLETVTLNNRAADLVSFTKLGVGSPTIEANPGTIYLDTDAQALYYKATGTDNTGWKLVYGQGNFHEGADYLAPNGSGEGLTNLQASRIEGVLPVEHGGTSASTFSSGTIYKGNGTNAWVAARKSVDYMVPSDLTGMICWFPVISDKIPNNWLFCDGRTLNKVNEPQYEPLFNVIGHTYGGSGNDFKLPNLKGYFIRGWDGTRAANIPQPDSIKSHTHDVTWPTMNNQGSHTHTKGDMDITGTFSGVGQSDSSSSSVRPKYSGAFYISSKGGGTKCANDGAEPDDLFGFKASKSWTGNTSSAGGHTHTLSGGSISSTGSDETCVKNYPMIPVIHI